MRLVLKLIGILTTISILGVFASSFWLVFAPPESLQNATATAARTICSNHYIAHRDVETIRRDDLVALGHQVFNYMKIDIDAVNQRVNVSLFGFFAERQAQYVAGWGCINVFKNMVIDPPVLPSPPVRPGALWPDGEKVQLSNDARLQAAINDTSLQGPGMRALVVVHDGHIVGEVYGQGFDSSTPLQGWSMTKTVNAALVGMAIGDGKLSLGQRNLFPQWAGDARAQISVADLMAMSGGLEWNEDQDAGRMETLASDAAGYTIKRPLVRPPGTKFNYSGGETVLLARLWMNAVGQGARSYPRERLFKPLGMTREDIGYSYAKLLRAVAAAF